MVISGSHLAGAQHQPDNSLATGPTCKHMTGFARRSHEWARHDKKQVHQYKQKLNEAILTAKASFSILHNRPTATKCILGRLSREVPPTKRNILDREGWVRYKRVYPIHFRENRIINQYNKKNIYICIYNDNNILFFDIFFWSSPYLDFYSVSMGRVARAIDLRSEMISEGLSRRKYLDGDIWILEIIYN